MQFRRELPISDIIMMFRLKQSQPFFVLFAVLFLFVPIIVFGRIGVGVGIGKIQVDKPLKPGMIYNLPSLPVLNTGDEPADYEVSIEYHEGVPQIRPAREWFHFEPQSFHLESGGVQTVKITLTLPTKTQPGDYFAYLEGHPVNKSEAGQTSIGVAAAAKLYFTVAPANIFQGIYYRILSLAKRYYPYDAIFLAIIVGAVLINIFRKKFKIQIAKK
jgi:hypothetical protein